MTLWRVLAWCCLLAATSPVTSCKKTPPPSSDDDGPRTRKSKTKSETPAPVDCSKDMAVCEAGCKACDTSCGKEAARQCFKVGQSQLDTLTHDGLTNAGVALERSCRNGHAQACPALAILHYDGRGVAHDKKRTVELHQQACDGGAGLGCFNLGLLYQRVGLGLVLTGRSSSQRGAARQPVRKGPAATRCGAQVDSLTARSATEPAARCPVEDLRPM